MKGDVKVIGHFNAVLSHTLASINQYFLHSSIYRNVGLTALAEYDYKISIKEMKYADSIIERVLFLEGLPNLQQISTLKIGEDVQEMVQCDMNMQLEIKQLLVDAVAYCESCADYVSRELFEEILTGEESFIDWSEIQLSLIDKIGIENYQQSQI